MLYLLFAPWTLFLVPFIGLWFILLVCELILYRQLDSAFQIEQQFIQLEGDPWREATYKTGPALRLHCQASLFIG